MLKCQEDSYLKEFTTKLVASFYEEFSVTVAPGTQKKVKGVGVVLEDTILFPEGGGQPCDEGTLDMDGLIISVKNVFRWQGRVVHLVDWACDHKLLSPGTVVRQRLNWTRRLYHMTQHTGQHLISALADKLFSFETLSWCLGPKSSYIELGAEYLSDDQFKTLENEINSCIEKNLLVSKNVYSSNDEAITNAKTRGLPKGHVGDVRVIVIEGVDCNMCCGTHVSSLKELEIVKLIKQERKVSKKKKVCLLHFMVGRNTIFKKFDEMRTREDLISFHLNKSPEEHVQTIVKLKGDCNKLLKKVKVLQEENAKTKISAFKSTEPLQPLFSFHSADGDLDLLNFVARQFKDTKVTLFLTIGEKEEGNLMLVGPIDVVAKAGPEICTVLKGKGQMTGNRFQAKVHHLSARKNAEDLVFSTLTQYHVREQFKK